jgi:hypothetical protein
MKNQVEDDKRKESESKELKILGFSTSDLAGLSVDELTNNKTAITMVMYYYEQLVEENSSLKNDLNTLNTYVAGYREKRINARTGAILLLLSNVLIGFGVNLLTSSNITAGLFVFFPGLVLAGFGLYFSLKEVD